MLAVESYFLASYIAKLLKFSIGLCVQFRGLFLTDMAWLLGSFRIL